MCPTVKLNFFMCFLVLSLQVIKRRPHLWLHNDFTVKNSYTTPSKSNLNKQACLSAPFFRPPLKRFLVSVVNKWEQVVLFEAGVVTLTLSSWDPLAILDWLQFPRGYLTPCEKRHKVDRPTVLQAGDENNVWTETKDYLGYLKPHEEMEVASAVDLKACLSAGVRLSL